MRAELVVRRRAPVHARASAAAAGARALLLAPALSRPSSDHFLLLCRPIPQGQIKSLAQSFEAVPEIYKRRPAGAPDIAAELGVSVPDWADLRRRREFDMLHLFGGAALQASTFVPTHQMLPLSAAAEAPSVLRTAHAKGSGRVGKTKAGASGRTYTSKYRGVHQTFPTKRWEAQFRRSGKPTSLGCFDREEEAARAYDKMMLWCELHHATGVKGGITNFDPSEYEGDLQWLQQVSQVCG